MAKVEFWDVKARAKVKADVIKVVKYENGRFAIKGETKDGRSLTRFVSAADAEKYKKDLKK